MTSQRALLVEFSPERKIGRALQDILDPHFNLSVVTEPPGSFHDEIKNFDGARHGIADEKFSVFHRQAIGLHQRFRGGGFAGDEVGETAAASQIHIRRERCQILDAGFIRRRRKKRVMSRRGFVARGAPSQQRG